MSDWQILLACGLWFLAGLVIGYVKQQVKIDTARRDRANAESELLICKQLLGWIKRPEAKPND